MKERKKERKKEGQTERKKERKNEPRKSSKKIDKIIQKNGPLKKSHMTGHMDIGREILSLPSISVLGSIGHWGWKNGLIA